MKDIYKIMCVLCTLMLILNTGCTNNQKVDDGVNETTKSTIKTQSELSTEEITEKTIQANSNLESYAFTMETDYSVNSKKSTAGIKGMTLGALGEGKFDQKNKQMVMELSTEMLGVESKSIVYTMGSMQYIYISSIGWLKNETGTDIFDKGFLLDSTREFYESSKVERIEDANVDGTECYVLSIESDPEQMLKFSEMYGNQIPESQKEEFVDSIKKIEYKDYIAKDTFLSQKTEILMEAETDNYTLATNLVLRVFDYNKPMEIELPDEARDAKDMDVYLRELQEEAAAGSQQA